MSIYYNIDWLKSTISEAQSPLDFIFFWGHTPHRAQQIDKSCFSQWFPSPFEVNNRIYLTAEHWMMAQKAVLFGDMAVFEQILLCQDPKAVKNMGRLVSDYKDEVWNAHKVAIVLEGNRHKFAQNPLLADFLLQTGDKILVEASPVDCIWGIGLAQEDAAAKEVQQWRGENLLGFILMQVRQELRRIAAP